MFCFTRPAFSSNSAIGKDFIENIIATTLCWFVEKEKYNPKMVDIGFTCSRLHIRPLDFGVLGDVLLWTLDRLLLVEISTNPQLRRSWTKFYCRFLDFILPLSAYLMVCND